MRNGDVAVVSSFRYSSILIALAYGYIIWGDVPDWLAPSDRAAWQAAILAYAQDASPDRAAQVRRLSGWRAPDWPGHFSQVEDLIGLHPADRARP